MMASLFSIFDPFTGVFGSTNWLALSFLVSFCGYSAYMNSSSVSIGLLSLLLGLKKEIDFSLGAGSALSALPVGVFLLVFLYNILGLSLYTFTPTSHLAVTLSLALTIWAGLIIYSLAKKPLTFFSHLLPVGTPVALMGFMVLIESVSVLIRPLTLAVRLMANMIAGHLLLSLSGMSFSSFMSFLPLIVAQSCLVGLELAVAVIQAYVFMVLVTLYTQEV